MRPYPPEVATALAGLYAAQKCRQRPPEPFPSELDDSAECLELQGHELCGLAHRSGNGTVWYG